MVRRKRFFGICINVTLGVLLSGGIINAAVTLSQNISVGGGTANVTLDGDDVYITGTFEVDGTSRLDGALTVNANLNVNGTATTTASSGNLAIAGLFTLNNDAAGDPIIRFQDAGTNIWLLGFDNSDANKLRITPLNGSFSATSSGLTIREDGFVGIGTTNPSTALHVGGTLTLDTDLSVANGGTGASTFTSGELLVGAGTSALTSTSTLAVNKGGTGVATFTSGELLVGAGTSALTSTSTLTVSKGGTGVATFTSGELLVGAGTSAMTSTSTLAVNKGGTGATSLTEGGVLFGGSVITASAVLANGQLLIGDGTGAPTVAGLTGTSNEITVTDGAGTITLDIPNSPIFVTPIATSTLSIRNSVADGDPILQFQDTDAGTNIWFVGFDNSDSDKFRITAAKTFTSTSTGITIDTAGRVGIGTTSPNTSLQINGNVRLDLETATSSSAAVCHSNGGQVNDDVLLVDCTGTLEADYAELYPTYGSPEQGDVVGLGSKYARTKDGDKIIKLTKTTKAYDSSAIGVVSEASGDFNVVGFNIDERHNPLPVALAGRVRVKVSLENGVINVGDRLTSSSVPGVAMRASKKGPTIGIALNAYDGSESNKILMFVNLTQQGE